MARVNSDSSEACDGASSEAGRWIAEPGLEGRFSGKLAGGLGFASSLFVLHAGAGAIGQLPDLPALWQLENGPESSQSEGKQGLIKEGSKPRQAMGEGVAGQITGSLELSRLAADSTWSKPSRLAMGEGVAGQRAGSQEPARLSVRGVQLQAVGQPMGVSIVNMLSSSGLV
eukprot:CAMPEP_0170600226 /NCGR_PEP_ID=MMETSP0224-20130122/17223_1 /TAXON_ID=285029 /ORGANISM="Togula jolla, Strain CCCM 725" /LENGTH=170 /DNA_ID=CAMNT_0010924941 /DNA_START=681 /DNA_END=1193 /DNA_ORIENTATION=+